jgi:hypothetical protein
VSAGWTCEIQDNGLVDVLHNGRSIAYDRDDLAEALAVAKRKGATQVTVIEQDGYRHRVKV